MMEFKSRILPLLVRIVVVLVTSGFVGWLFRRPNAELLQKALRKRAKWKRDDFISITKSQESFFSGYYFEFNFEVALLVFLVLGGAVYLHGKNKP